MDKEMPKVNTCAATGCYYNHDQGCHAMAVTVGNETTPACDTMKASTEHVHRNDVAGVGACKTIKCKHNDDMLCQADFVEIVFDGDEAMCNTFRAL